VSGRPVRVVLDTSAIIAYTHGSMDVGEVIAEVDDEEGAVAIPVLCLIEAYRVAADRDRVDVLVSHPATVVLDIEPADWRAVADLADAGGRTDAAVAALLAVDYRATLLTRQPGWYAGMAADFPIINF
jgi:predicted nucleic acid-binding protein